MIEDHYATLGVHATADDVMIRASYLALMRRYHPDRNTSPEAVEHARAVISSFAILGDPEKRMRYDWDRRRAAEAAAGLSPRRPLRVTPRGMAITLIALLSLVTFAALRAHFARSEPPIAPTIAQQPEAAPARTIASASLPVQDRTPVPAPTPDAPSQPAEVRPQTKLPIPTPPSPPIEAASLAPAVTRLATPPARQRKSATVIPSVAPPKPSEPRKVAVRIAPKTAVVSKPAVVPKPAAPPRKPTENIVALERNGTTFFNQSYKYGKSEQRLALTSSRNAYLARRDACESESCLRDASLRHVREINAIMQDAQLKP